VSGERTSFLYPFIDAEEIDSEALLADLASSARSKLVQSRAIRRTVVESFSAEILKAGEEIAWRFASGGRLFTFGNGGSSTDAKGAAELFLRPSTGIALPAVSLVDDPAVITALSNDIGFEVVFSRQVIAHVRPGDVVLGFSTSGDSANVIRGLSEAASRGALAVGFAGYGGGAMSTSESLDYCFVVPSDSVHRIQETQDAIVSELWTTVQHLIGRERGD
jgi:D-sedoheptulose 7-phosphate isomerase